MTSGGAYRRGLISGWMDVFGEPGVIIELQQNEVYNPWWYTLSGPLTVHNDPRPQWGYFNQSVVHFAGFYDIFSSGQIVSALAVNESAQSGAVGRQILIVDPGSFSFSDKRYIFRAQYFVE